MDPAFLASTPGSGLLVPLLVGLITVVAVILSVIGRFALPKAPPIAIYLLSPVAAALLIYGYFFLRQQADIAAEPGKARARRQRQEAMAEVMQLKSWRPVPNAENPTELHLEIEARASGNLAVQVRMGTMPTDRNPPAQSFLLEQFDPPVLHPVKAGETAQVVIPLLRVAPGRPDGIALTLSLHDPATARPGYKGATLATVGYANFPIDYLDQLTLELPPPAK